MTRGSRLAASIAMAQSAIGWPAPLMVACATMPRMRCLNSPSNPFITEITVIKAVTPMAMPSIEASEMKLMKWLRRLARV